MGIAEKLEKKKNELKILMGNGIVKLVFEDGSEEEIEDKKDEKIIVGGLTEEKINVLKDPIASRLYYMLLLRAYNKFGIAKAYYGKKKNIARRVIDEAMDKLEKNGFINKVEWNEIFKKKYKITEKSKYVYLSDVSNLILYIFSEFGEIIPEYYFLIFLFKTLNPNELFFEWNVSEIREEEVDVIKLMKIKLLYLLSISLYLRTKYHEAWSSTAELYVENFRTVIRKLTLLFRFADYPQITSYFLSILQEETHEVILEELNEIILRQYEKENNTIFNLVLFFMYWPSDLIIDFLDKLSAK